MKIVLYFAVCFRMLVTFLRPFLREMSAYAQYHYFSKHFVFRNFLPIFRASSSCIYPRYFLGRGYGICLKLEIGIFRSFRYDSGGHKVHLLSMNFYAYMYVQQKQ